MLTELNHFDITSFPIGKKMIEDVAFPSFYGMQEVRAPIFVYRATKEVSPCVVVTSCVHGDEIAGMRIAQSVMKSKMIITRGTLIIIPIVNIYGFLNKSRYLPDRKDLNRCFPGKEIGSFGARFARVLMKSFGEIGDLFIDLHSGGAGRLNIPQIRCDLDSPHIEQIIANIHIPLIVNSSLRDGSFRESINALGKPCLVFEGGEGLRIDETVTRHGSAFIRSILEYLKMIAPSKKNFQIEHIVIKKTKWIRAHQGGILINRFKLGKIVKKDELIGELRDTRGGLLTSIYSPADGVILGMTKVSLIMAGDALYNLGFLGIDQPFEEDIFDWE